MTTTLHVAASVQSDQPKTITRAFEAFGRAAVGLALEGAQITIDVGPVLETDDSDDESEQP